MTITAVELDSTPRTILDDALSAPVVAALEATWSAIRARNPEVPAVVIVLASGTIGVKPGAVRLGHFAAMRWNHDGARLPEVFVGGEGLARGAVDVLGTLLHEATHALAHVRSVKDTSRQGRYHNRRFQTLAGEIGLDVREVPVIGWSETRVPEATATEYAAEIAHLAHALTIHRYAESALGASTGPGKNGPDGEPDGDEDGEADRPAKKSNTCRCECGRRISVAPAVRALGPITCSICGTDFAPST